MAPEKMEELFELQLQAVQLMQNALKSSFYDAYIEHIENMIDSYQVRVIDGVPEKEVAQQLQKIYDRLAQYELSAEEKRKMVQLLLLKGMQTEPLQPNHQLTPDGIGFLFVYLIEQLAPKKEQPLRLLDLTVGMGNLLLTAMTNLSLANYKEVTGIGVDNDETLLEIAAANAEWIAASLQLFHQDGLQELLIEPMDIAFSDLPIGYYPNDEKAQNFISGVSDEHSYAHHLLMEQSMNYVKEAGFGLFLVPSNFLESEQSEALKGWFKERVYMQGIIQLPDDLFKHESARKSILIVQNHGKQANQVTEVLLAKLATLKNPESIASFFKQFEEWKQEQEIL